MIHGYNALQVTILHLCYWVLIFSSAGTLTGVLRMFSQVRARKEIYRFEIVATGICGVVALLALMVLIQIFASMML